MLRRIRRAVACMLVLVLFAGAVGRTEEALVTDAMESMPAFAKQIVIEEEAADLAEVPEAEVSAAAEADSIDEELPTKGSEEELISVPEVDSVEESPAEESDEDSVEEAPEEEALPASEEEERFEEEVSPDEADAFEMEELCAMPLMLGMARARDDFEIGSSGLLEAYYGSDTVIRIPDTATAIADEVFLSNGEITVVTIPNSVLSIGNRAFANCTSLSSVVIPESVTSIGENAFDGCDKLTLNVYSGSMLHDYCKKNNVDYKIVPRETAGGFQYDLAGDEATVVGYVGKAADVQVPNEIDGKRVVGVKNGVFSNNAQVSSITFPADVELNDVENGFFLNCSSLECATLPNSYISIPLCKDFAGCGKLTSVKVYSGHSNWKSVDGVLYDKSGETLIYFPPGRSGSFDVPEGVSKIAAGAFSGSALSRVKLHSGISEIGENAFAGTKNFRAVVKEGSYALRYCSNNGIQYQLMTQSVQLSDTHIRAELSEQELYLNATVLPASAGQELEWSSDKPSVATVEDGNVTLHGVGRAVITCRTMDGSGVFAQCVIEVAQSAAPTQITLDRESLSLTLDSAPVKLNASVSPDSEVTWTSSAPEVATVEDGLVTPVGGGVALVRCAAGGASAQCIVIVDGKRAVSEIRLNYEEKTLDLAKEEILTLTATITPENATNKAVTWTSSDSSAALVGSDGTVHPRKVGTATITCTAADGSGVHAECVIEVINSAANTKITLSETSLQLKSGETRTLTCTVTLETDVTWASSNSAVAAVRDGEITALGAGVALISCTADNGSGASASCLVTVTDRTPVAAITLNHSSAKLDLAKNETLSISAEIAPENATNKAVSWTSSDSSAALVGSDGTVHPRKVGTATITCTAADGSDVHAECVIEVINSAANTEITLSEISLQLKSGETRTLTYEAVPETDVTWASSNSAVANVQNGKITALGAGVALISCTATNGSGASTSCLVTVDGSVPVVSVTLNRTSATLNRAENEMLALQASVLPTNASNPQLRWSSSDPAVAAVTASGVVIPMGAGKTIITATALDGSGKEASCSVTVREQVKPTAVELTPPAVTLNLASGEKCALTAKIVPANASYGGFSWSSSDAGIARVSAGVVTPISAGIAVITCAADGAAGVQASCIVTVVNSVPVHAIELSEAELRLSVGEARALYAKILPENADDGNVVWSSSDEDVAFVASNGTVVARSAGTALVSCASAGNASVRASCRVTVTNRAAVQEIALNRENLTLNIAAGEVCALTATLKPEGASVEVVWSSTNEAVAVVTGDGLVVPLAEGSASIICTSAENSAVRAVCELRVVRSKLPTNIILFENDVKLDWSTGESRYLQSILLPSDATERALVWHSSNEAVAHVKDGVVTPVFVGSAVISCALAADSSVRAACTVQVYASREPDDLHITGQARQNLLLGESMQLGAQLVPANSYSEVKWSSSDETIASVDESGCVTALKEGEAQITATAENGAADVAYFKIIDPSMPTGVELSGENLSLGAGERIQMEARVLPETAVAELIWESSDAKIAKVDESGRVHGVKKGEAELRVTAVGADGRRFSEEMKIEVKYAPAEVKLNQKRLLLYVGGEGAQLCASVGAKCASVLAWSSSDEAVATVDEDGMIEPIAPGSAVIRCKTFNGKSAKCAVTVSPMPEGIELEEAELNMYPRQSRRLRARLVDGSGAVCAGEISYASSHPEQVSVSADGKLTVKTAVPGTAEILLTGPNGLTAQAYVTVCRAPERVELSETRIELGVGEEYQLYPIIGEDEATQFSFASGNKRVASVDRDGLITAKRVGTAKITVRTHNKKYASLTVRVSTD